MTVRGGPLRTFVLACALLIGPLQATGAAEPKGKSLAVKKSARTPKRTRPPAAEKSSGTAAAPIVAEQSAGNVPEAAAPAARSSKPRVYTFGGLDVEGKLKAPQLLYFRSRMRQELDTSTSETRSFLKELEKSADEKGL